ncbi:serine/threonine protein kinase [Candidatus Poribacteria bacterium]|nr:serine/threonine protein kinase [Candidatus Poribacteria bacterium]MYH82233.1 serine/threonine protein kinase [Candidatus Poribacteria bacterium]MYK93253.1 serine/threonine protein kinase [Candidatus Poribacteria bacterium]
MPTEHPLLHVTEIDTDIETYLTYIAETTYQFPEHDSGCQSFQVVVNDQRWFVKHSNIPQSVTWLKQAVRFHAAVQHEALPQLHNAFTTTDGFTLVYDWVDGDGLRPERKLRADEVHPRDRFCALPASEIIAVLNVIYDVHVLIEKRGFIAEDFYDGCIIYNFEKKRTHLYDFDHYHPAPFINDRGRLNGSSRFMAPEEFQKGERIDERTNVFMLGRTAFVLLANNSDSRNDWKGNDALWHVAKKATNVDKRLRYPSVQEFASAWHAAIATSNIPSA